MFKRALSSATLPPAKRLNLDTGIYNSAPLLEFEVLSDEVILHVFHYLSWTDLCTTQVVSHTWSRLALDNQLWKSLYRHEHGPLRTRGRSEGLSDIIHPDRDLKPLPHRSRVTPHEIKDWKTLFRISHNWSRGRCSVKTLPSSSNSPASLRDSSMTSQSYSSLVLSGRLIFKAACTDMGEPQVMVHHLGKGTHYLPCSSAQSASAAQITTMVLDLAGSPSAHSSRLAVFMSSGEYAVFKIEHASPTDSAGLTRYVPRVQTTRNTPIIQAAYHHPLLVTLSASFRLTIFDLSGEKPRVTETLSSFTSYLPSSMVLSSPTSSTSLFATSDTTTSQDIYKLVLAYSVAVYPAHYSIGVTEVLIRDFVVFGTRTARTCEVPFGFIDERAERAMREQWGRRVATIADTCTDGRWVVLGPDVGAASSPNTLQLYRLQFPPSPGAQVKVSFVRYLHGLDGSVATMALAGGRCVCVGTDGSIRVWDVDRETTAEIRGPLVFKEGCLESLSILPAAVVFDDRKVVSVGLEGLQIRRFDI